MADHDVLFFGCVVVTLVEVRVKHSASLREAQRSSGVTFRVRAAVVPAEGADVAEQMGASVDSTEHPLQSAAMAEELLLPVMFERTSFIAAPAGDSGRPDAGQSRADSRDVAADGGSDRDRVEAQLVLEISVARGGKRSNVARRTVMIDSLLDIAGESCGVVTARVAAATACRRGVWGPAAQPPPLDKTPVVISGDNDGDVGSDVELQFIVRAFDMSEPVRIMLGAEREAHTVLPVPQDKPRTMFVLPVQRLAYGVLPLVALYHYYCRFFEHFFNKTLKPSKYVLGLFDRVGMDRAGFCWSALNVVDLRPVLLGDDALAPFLATLYHCPSLSSLVLDQNSVSDLTCYRLSALFCRHYHLHEVSMRRNAVHECGAEQLLRLVRRNKHVLRLDASGNPCSSRVLERIQRVTRLNQEALEKDPYNVLSSAYDYATSPTSISSSIVKKALAVWAMLSIAPLRPADCTVDDKVCLLIPQCALAPLLNEVMRTAALRMSQTLQNPVIVNVFADIESHWKAASAMGNDGARQGLREGDGEVGKKRLEVTEPEAARAEIHQEIKSVSASFSDVEELYSCSFLRAIIVTMRSFMLEASWTDTVAVLKEIGRRQRALGVMPGHYRDALKVFVESLTTVCGREETDVEHSAAFFQCLAMGIRVVLAT